MTTEIGSGLFGHRVNIRAQLPDPVCEEKFFDEVISAADGRYLGAFTSLYTAPFGLRYPVGWTHGTWVEQPGIAFVGDASCGCTDCNGSTPAVRVRQRTPDEPIGCDNASVFDYYDFSVMPDRYTGEEGCFYRFFPENFCGDPAAPGGACGVDISLTPWLHEPYPWPLVAFAFANASSRIRVVEDTSGPEGCEDVLALEVDFSGAGNEGVTFVGEGGGFDGVSPPQTGVFNADRSATGWTVEDDSCWIEKFWIKAVPDNDDFVCEGYDIITRAGLYPFPFARVSAGGDPGPLVLDGEWQEWYWVWTANYTGTPNPLLNAMWGIYTTATNDFEPDPPDPTCNLPRYARKGRVHIKQPHLAACATSDGVIIKRPSGLGT